MRWRRPPLTPPPQRPLGLVADAWGPLRAFAHRGYGRLWLANFLSYTPRWMQLTLLAWLILELTDSPWLVALVGFFSSIPMLLFGLLGGVLADRFHRQRLLVGLQAVNVVGCLLFTLTLAVGVVEVWQGYGVIFITGASWALGFPARRALIFDLLGTTGIANAVALDAVGMNGSRMIGPALAGAIIALGGVTSGFVLITCCYAIGLVLLWSLQVEPVGRPCRSPQNIVYNLVEGFRYVGRHQVILADVCITVIMNFLLFPYMQMIPVLARDVLHVGPTMMGFLQGAEGVGAMIGSILIATLTMIRYHGRYFVVGSMVSFVALFILSLSSWYIVSFPTLLILGIGSACFGTMQSTLVMLMADEGMRGRALGVVSLAIGAGPLGSLLLGALADAISPVFAVRAHALCGIVLLSCTVLVLPAIMDTTDRAD